MVNDFKNTTPINTEVEEAIRTLKKNKMPGSDGITAEMLQAGEEQLPQQIDKLCTNHDMKAQFQKNVANIF